MIFGKKSLLSIFGKWIYGRPGISAPSTVNCTVVNDTTVQFTWGPCENAAGYRIYDENENLIQDVGNVLSWQETGYIPNISKVRKMLAYDADNVVSEFSSIFQGLVPLSTSTIGANNITFSSINWTWSRIDLDYVVGYRVYDGNDNLIADVGNASSYTESNIEADTDYTRYVKAYTEHGYLSDASNLLTQRTSLVPGLSSFVATPVDYNHIKFDWVYPDENVDGFKIFDSNNTVIAILNNNDLRTYTQSGFAPNISFTFYAVAYYKNKQSLQSNTSTAATLAEPPAISSIDSLNNIDPGLRINIDNKGNPSNTTYEIYCFTTGKTIFTGTKKSFDFTNLIADTIYQFQVRAKNISGIYTVYSSVFSFKCTYPIRIQLHGGINQVFNTGITLDLIAPEGYFSKMVIIDDVNRIYGEYTETDKITYNTSAAYTLPNKHGEITLSVIFFDQGGYATPPFTVDIIYYRQLPVPDLFVGQTNDGVSIEGLNLRPSGYGSESPAAQLTGYDMAYISKRVSGFNMDLYAVATGSQIKLYDRNWSLVQDINLSENYHAIAFDASDNCLWVQGSESKFKKLILSETDGTFSYTNTGIAVASIQCSSICTDGSYMYGIVSEHYIYKWGKNGGLVSSVDVANMIANINQCIGIEYYNGYIYIGSDTGYLNVIDVSNFDSVQFTCQIQSGISNISKLCIDGFYIYVSDESDIPIYRYSLVPRIDIYRSYDDINYSLFADDVAIKMLDTESDRIAPFAPSLNSLSHVLYGYSSDNTIDIKVINNITGSTIHVSYYIIAHDTYGHETENSEVKTANILPIIVGYSVAWDTNKDTIPPETVNETDTSFTSDPLPDNTGYYVHIRCATSKFIYGQTAHMGPFNIDSSIPNIVGVALTPSIVNVLDSVLVQVMVSDL